MLNYVYRSLKLLLIPFLILLSGCEVPLIYLYNAGNSQKDVSDDYKRGHVMGKEYVLLLDGFVTQFKDSKELYFEKNLTTMYTFENGKKVNVDPYLLIRSIPKGTRFKVCSVLVATNYGTELCSQHIMANIIDENGAQLVQFNFQGIKAPVDISRLFLNTFEMPNQDWVFRPYPTWIKEVNSVD